ncbi:acyl carrier protein 1, chloroplastic-like [Zingiber officinale]|uniref:acyl carrier protein 1, chloroplastic-like n=1 Tax=Zingiber officinale TaxID=94328 RepID=UPI001C4D6C67|nr:acyl carrier protein 1, chloroplastic-like [Zingiber officinale]
MASVAGTAFAVSVRPPRRLQQVSNHLSGLKSVSFTSQRKSFVSIRSAPRFRISCAAKPETLEKVCSIVKKQLALAENALVTGESTFVQLGADSLDTVEVVMGLEEEFGISVEEENAQTIQTVQDAADMIEILLEKKNAA